MKKTPDNAQTNTNPYKHKFWCAPKPIIWLLTVIEAIEEKCDEQ